MKIRNAEILCVGTEILIGDIVNTNAAYLSKKLAELGIAQYYQGVVGDNPERLRARMEEALSRCDLLILGGGLGPTYDDLTKETAASVMGKKLVFHEGTYARLRDFCEKRNIPLDSRDKQALLPEGAVVFDNHHGTAPGTANEFDGKIVIMLPGPPREQIPMIDNQVIPYLSRFTDGIIVSRNVNLVGIGEADAASRVADLIEKSDNPTIAPYCGDGEMRFRVTAKAKDKDKAEKIIQKGIDALYSSGVSEYIIGVDTDIQTALVNALKRNSLTIATAESLTGGLISEMITRVPGSSAVLGYSFTVYSEEAKMRVLSVKKETLEKYTVYSEETAREMAKGAAEKSGAQVALSVTGIAGPDGGDERNPVGTVYAGGYVNGKLFSKKFSFTGDREHIRMLTAKYAMEYIYSLIIGEYE